MQYSTYSKYLCDASECGVRVSLDLGYRRGLGLYTVHTVEYGIVDTVRYKIIRLTSSKAE